MPYRLIPHPASPCPDPVSVDVRLKRAEAGGIALVFHLRGSAHLTLPAPASPGPADELWRHTCCEVFVAVPGEAAYREFNFSPSGQWAFYRFADYRLREVEAAIPACPPGMALRDLPGGMEMEIDIPREWLPTRDSPLQVGLTAVIEGRDGQLSYWALHHPCPRPDFHQREGFTLVLPQG